LRDEAAGLFAPKPPLDPNAPWPEGERVDLQTRPESVDRAALERATTAAFAESGPAHPRNTRALVVLYQGRIVAERYAPPFDVSTPFLGWSMSKAALNALIGERVRDRKLAVAGSALPEWQGSHDRRRDITLDQLLRMTSGLAFDETYSNNDSDVIQMLFVQGDMAGFATVKPLVHPPGSDWNYSSGTSLVLARLLRNSFASEHDYLRFPRERLFDPLGMRSAVIEPDAGGAGLGAARATVPAGWRLARSPPAARGLGRLHTDPGAARARRKIRCPYVAEAPSRSNWASRQCRRTPITCWATTSRSLRSSRPVIL
jgi:CubicO group peptidase (beta-lactamase class C family)